LLLAQPALFTGAVSGFQQGDGIDLAGLIADAASYANGVLTLSAVGGDVAQLSLTTPVTNPFFTLAADGQGGTQLGVLPHHAAVFAGTYHNTILLDQPSVQNPALVTTTGVIAVAGEVGILGTAGVAWTLTNLGTVTSDGGTGVDLTAGGAIVNRGLISGAIGVADAGSLTLTNAGTVVGSGGIATALGGDGRVVVEPGAVFSGIVDGGGGSALELAAAPQPGTLTGLGTGFVRFATVAVDPAAVWSLIGDDTVSAGTTLAVAGTLLAAGSLTNDGQISVAGGSLLVGAVGEDAGQHGAMVLESDGVAEFAGTIDAGQSLFFADATGIARLDEPSGFAATITGFQTGDVIDLAHLRATGLDFADGVLTLTNAGGTVATLNLAGAYASSEFALTADHAGGTRLTVSTPPVPPPATELFQFVYVYADGAAYYTGTVADNGSLGYAAIAASGNPTIVISGLGTYTLTEVGTTTEPSAAVKVAQFFSSTNSGASYTPFLTQQGLFDGSAGLGSEADTISVSNTQFAFSNTFEPRPSG
jgi:hypothetical protein